MVAPLWPSQRSDGTLAVAARYLVTRPEARVVLRSYLDDWLQSHPARALALDELSTPPHVDEAGEERIDIVFDAEAGSRLWKDVMVAVVRDVPVDAGLEFEGFCDLLTGRLHAASPGLAQEH